MVNGMKRFSLNKGTRNRVLLNQTRKEGNMIYGGQSLKAQMGGIARNTRDFDILSKNPSASAKITRKNFNKVHGRNDFFVKQGKYKDTKKVMWKGMDERKNTRDDVGMVDYTRQRRNIPFRKIRGVKYSTLAHETKTKKQILQEKGSSFRHEKDIDDLERIKFWRRRL
jgi:hypothetical protein